MSHTTTLSGSFYYETICLHYGTVVLLMCATELYGHCNFIIQVGEAAVRVS